MMNKMIILLVVLGFTALSGCREAADLSPRQRYERDLAAARKAELTHDEVFLGLKLGVPRQAYFDRCTVLNREKKITMSGGGNAVDHQLPDELPRPAVMTIAPDFGEDRKTVRAYDVLFSYVDWSPWNKAAHGTQLMEDLKPFLAEHFGEGFYAVSDPQRGEVWVKFDGKRRVEGWVEDERVARVRVGVVFDS